MAATVSMLKKRQDRAYRCASPMRVYRVEWSDGVGPWHSSSGADKPHGRPSAGVFGPAPDEDEGIMRPMVKGQERCAVQSPLGVQRWFRGLSAWTEKAVDWADRNRTPIYPVLRVYNVIPTAVGQRQVLYTPDKAELVVEKRLCKKEL